MLRLRISVEIAVEPLSSGEVCAGWRSLATCRGRCSPRTHPADREETRGCNPQRIVDYGYCITRIKPVPAVVAPLPLPRLRP